MLVRENLGHAKQTQAGEYLKEMGQEEKLRKLTNLGGLLTVLEKIRLLVRINRLFGITTIVW